jgi:hypothetical protein
MRESGSAVLQTVVKCTLSRFHPTNTRLYAIGLHALALRDDDLMTDDYRYSIDSALIVHCDSFTCKSRLGKDMEVTLISMVDNCVRGETPKLCRATGHLRGS